MMGMLIFALGGFTVGLICGVCIGSVSLTITGDR